MVTKPSLADGEDVNLGEKHGDGALRGGRRCLGRPPLRDGRVGWRQQAVHWRGCPQAFPVHFNFDGQVYNPSTNRWRSLPKMNTPRWERFPYCSYAHPAPKILLSQVELLLVGAGRDADRHRRVHRVCHHRLHGGASQRSLASQI